MNEMYSLIEKLCNERKINMTQMCKEADIPRGNLTDLKKGRTVALATKNLSKISAYFGVPIDYLLGTDPKEKAPTTNGERKIGFDDFTYAMQNETKELTDADKDLLLSMARQLSEARKRKDGESNGAI